MQRISSNDSSDPEAEASRDPAGAPPNARGPVRGEWEYNNHAVSFQNFMFAFAA